MAVITGYYANLTRSVKLIPWPGGHEVLFVATSDRLPGTDHQYATLMSPNQGETAVCGSPSFVG